MPSVLRSIAKRSLVVLVFCLLAAFSETANANQSGDHPAELARQLSEQLSTQEWLGPMAAIALSPFFGLACLSGIGTYGPEALRTQSAMLTEHGPMNNPYLFWSMVVLTIITSLPRFTKLSKPLSLLAEKLEAYSAIIILVSMRFFSLSGGQIGDAMPEVAMAGVGTWSVDVMMSIAAIVNLVVINTVKLAIEFLVWLMPFPLVDSVFEIINKSVCGALAILYAYIPLLSFMLNLCIFAACAFVFLKVVRLLNYFKKIYIWPTILKALGKNVSNSNSFPAFTTVDWGKIPAQSQIKIIRGQNGSLEVFYDTWLDSKRLGTGKWLASESALFVDKGKIVWSDDMESTDRLEDSPLSLEAPRGALSGAVVSGSRPNLQTAL